MSLRYSNIIWIAPVNKVAQPNMEYSYKAKSTRKTLFNFVVALGDKVSTYASHNTVSEILTTIPYASKKSSKGLMWKDVVAWCYNFVCSIGLLDAWQLC